MKLSNKIRKMIQEDLILFVEVGMLISLHHIHILDLHLYHLQNYIIFTAQTRDFTICITSQEQHWFIAEDAVVTASSAMSEGMPSPKSGTTHYLAQLVDSDKSHTIKGLSAIVGMLVTIGLVKRSTLRCYQSSQLFRSNPEHCVVIS